MIHFYNDLPTLPFEIYNRISISVQLTYLKILLFLSCAFVMICGIKCKAIITVLFYVYFKRDQNCNSNNHVT